MPLEKEVGEKKLTPKMIEGLRWFISNGPVAWFGHDAPSLIIRTRLERGGLIEEAGLERGERFPGLKYQISKAGREALTALEEEK